MSGSEKSSGSVLSSESNEGSSASSGYSYFSSSDSYSSGSGSGSSSSSSSDTGSSGSSSGSGSGSSHDCDYSIIDISIVVIAGLGKTGHFVMRNNSLNGVITVTAYNGPGISMGGFPREIAAQESQDFLITASENANGASLLSEIPFTIATEECGESTIYFWPYDPPNPPP